MSMYLSRNLLASSIFLAMLATQAYAQDPASSTPSNGAPAAGQESPTSQAPVAEKKAVQLQNVTVTAQRRQESVQKVPISITTLDSIQLQRMNVTRIDDMKFVVPNVVIEQNTALNTGLKIFMRGVGQDESMFTAEPAVGLYLNDVYIPRMTGAMLSVFDVERIEVLRGPQGTLFGRNATGGAIRYITKKPTGETYLKLNASVGNYGRRDLGLNFSTRLGKDIDVTGAVMSSNRAGYIHDLTHNRDVNNVHQNAARTTVAMPWGDSTYATLNLDYTRDTSGATYAVPVKLDTNGKLVPVLGSFYDTRTNTPGSNILRSWGSSLTTDTDLGTVSLRNVLSARGLDNEFYEDLDGTEQTRYHLYQNQKERSYSYEAQLISQLTGPFSWVGGFYAFRETNSQPTRNDIFGPGATNYISQQDNAYALYWQGDYAFTDRLKLTGGARYSIEKKDFLVVSVRPNGSQAFTVAKSNRWKRPDWKLALDYDFAENVMGYASLTTGFKSGGFNGRGTTVAALGSFNAETLTAYEMGIKSSLLDNRVRFNIDYYRNDYAGIQLSAVDPNGVFSVTNATGAVLSGVEMDAQAQVTDAWQVGGGFGTIDAKYQNYAPVNAATFAGMDLKDAPKFQWHLSTTYIQSLANADLIWTAAVKYTDKYYENQALSPIIMTPTHLDARARISYEPRNANWSVALWGNNLTNNHISAGGFDIAGLGIAVIYPTMPRTYGVDFKYRF
ncbi:TonB-dependent receptor [Rhodanobacter sp. AS-Z3]|uniref:TonB-dependent receptor n=1 Tax=Rhodanobacter sp. AS-Z3 TaxID=3031330 RepID=UPI00247B1B19|nr:TonB-dependent receptor [Rhodanobacter sp. AS-Z3]WEN14127.1 TonB-dependent receptor [Rhodanobacter sp. AS-Z3]